MLISGTASIVGHQTLHPGDLSNQLATTFDNIDLLLNSISRSRTPLAAKPTLLKVYIRHASDLAVIRAAVERAFPAVPTRYLQGDICRKELLVELEGLAELVSPDHAG